MEEKKNNVQEQEFQAPETENKNKSKGKFLGLSKKQWGGISLAAIATFAGGFFAGHKVGKKQSIKRGYSCGRAVGAIINNCPETEASNVLGTDASRLKAQDQEYLGLLRSQGRIK